MAKTRDLYLNFAALESAYDAANSSTLTEEQFNTGLSVRGNLAWLIHLVEMYVPGMVANAVYQISYGCLSTLPNRAALPTLVDNGTIAFCSRETYLVTSGAYIGEQPIRTEFMPPVVLASPNISLYGNSNADHATLRSKPLWARVDFTTVDVDSPLYAEIAEVWGY